MQALVAVVRLRRSDLVVSKQAQACRRRHRNGDCQERRSVMRCAEPRTNLPLEPDPQQLPSYAGKNNSECRKIRCGVYWIRVTKFCSDFGQSHALRPGNTNKEISVCHLRDQWLFLALSFTSQQISIKARFTLHFDKMEVKFISNFVRYVWGQNVNGTISKTTTGL